MKKSILIIILLLVWSVGFSQNTTPDSLKNELAKASQDTVRLRLMNALCDIYMFSRPDSALHYGYKALDLSTRLHKPHAAFISLVELSFTYQAIGDYAKALQLILRSLKICNQNNLTGDRASALGELGRIYTDFHDYKSAKKVFEESIAINDSLGLKQFSTIDRVWFSKYYMAINKPDSAAYYAQAAYNIAQSAQYEWGKSFALSFLAIAQYRNGNTALAFKNLKIAERGLTGYLNPGLTIAQLYEESGNRDSSLIYANRALRLALKNGFYSKIVDAYTFLSKLYQNDPKKAYLYSNLALTYKDSLFNTGMTTAGESFVTYNEQEQQHALEEARKENQSRIRTNTLLGSLFTLLLVAIILFLYSRSRQKAKRKIESAYEQLKSTQSQLIQSEKMASLGELTAGIAHEIQNPLNFVNNFSEVSTELLEEMKVEIGKGNMEEVNTLVGDVIQNLDKILHHGQRADSIVKGMLQHSRGSSGEKVFTDINALADEYLRLSYHGLRAKDKSFNADFKLEADKTLPKINVVPQDIGRVLLNLINNAFYAVSEKAKQNPDGYKPFVIVSTRSEKSPSGGRGVEISVKDNGDGIPESVKEKIFQPFFTTKPTGQGTGLGLSLSYDIVKAHGGDIKVETREGEGTEFFIQIPFS